MNNPLVTINILSFNRKDELRFTLTKVFEQDYKKIIDKIEFDKTIYTGPIDYFFDYKFGKLPYRSIKFEWENLDLERLQEVAVTNFVASEKYTRITEYKHLTGQENKATSLSYEYPTFDGEPYYPIANRESKDQTRLYKNEISKVNNTQFIGRLAENKYYNMDGVVAKVLNEFK